MLSMQNSPYSIHPGWNASGLQDEGCSARSDIPTLSGINTLRGSISSASTGASPDDTSTDSPDWNGEQSPEFDASKNFQSSSDGGMVESRAHDMVLSDIPPKVEELDDDVQSVKRSEVGNEFDHENSGAPATVPRKRGRPRKHPLPTPGGQAKVTKGRSKTGCITCRRRKKKCDETKPA